MELFHLAFTIPLSKAAVAMNVIDAPNKSSRRMVNGYIEERFGRIRRLPGIIGLAL